MNSSIRFYCRIQNKKNQNRLLCLLYEIRKILVIRFSSLGDITLSFPLLKKLREKFISAEIHFLTKETYGELAVLNKNIDKILYLNDSLKNIRNQIREDDYDLIIDLQKNLKSVYISAFNGKEIARYRKGNFKKMLLVLFKINLIKTVVPVYQKYLQTVKKYLKDDDYGFSMSELLFSKDRIIDEKYVVISPSSRHFTKTYPKEKFAEYINSLKNVKAVLIGEKSEKDTEICSYIESRCSGILNMCGKLNMKSLLNILYNSEYVVCNDSAILHLSEAAGKRVIAVFGSTVKEFGFFPQLKSSAVIENNSVKCRPCTHIGRDRCPKGHFRCMDLEIEMNND